MALSDDPEISGSTTATLTIIANNEDIGTYTVEVSNNIGSVLSEPAILGIRPSCAGDIDGNGVVDTSDLLAVLAAWGPCP